MRRLWLLPSSAVFLALLSGCSGNCKNLSTSLCNCAANTNEKNNCLQRVNNRASQISVTDAQEQECGILLPQCDCHTVGTVEGKYKCGLARLPFD
jgi:hypothetical protein